MQPLSSVRASSSCAAMSQQCRCLRQAVHALHAMHALSAVGVTLKFPYIPPKSLPVARRLTAPFSAPVKFGDSQVGVASPVALPSPAVRPIRATECHLVIEWPSPLMCGKFGHAEEPPTVRTAAWKTMGCLMAIAVVSAAILYLIRKTRFWASVRTRVNRSMGYKHSTLVTYTAQDPQEEWTEFETLND